MKKNLFVLFFAIGAYFAANSQNPNPHAIGLRIGGGAGYGAEISYQHGFGQKNRLELDLGFGGHNDYGSIGLAGIYQWVFNISDGWHWYVGPGAALSFNTYDGSGNNDNYVGLAIGGQIGIEYDFKFPLQLSLDTRPMFDFLADADGFGWGIALGVRYKF